ncbi:UDP-glycosyltransferase [Ladona fulva]|uniref:UDP-glycosyltransferase n=1 Tax=Ladona fulva TaxID=123851 RepID=A0A8K0KE52_LADFU|nr:UDP-glycosyltransferase [Ladona fulva]
MKTFSWNSNLVKFPILFIFPIYFLLTCSPTGDAAQILVLIPSPAPSHCAMFQAVLKELAKRGHSIEVASPIRTPDPIPKGYTDVILPAPYEKLQSLIGLNVAANNTPFGEHLNLWSLADPLCEAQLSSPELQKYISQGKQGTKKYDLVIVEMFFFDCLIGFAHHFNAPLIGMVSQFALPWGYDSVGSPIPYSTVPNTFLHYGPHMTFMERVHNFLFTTGASLYRRFISLPKQTEVARRYFGIDMPPIWEIEENMSLVMMNGHPAVTPIHPTVPNLVDVAGMHILVDPPKLPQDLLKILQMNKKVILLSLGSVINSKTIEKERLMVILNALKEMPYPVIWRWDGEVSELPMALPAEVHVFKWLPQQSLLAHPNLVCFVSHGGLLSLQEATYHGVPIVGFPFFGDQFLNLNYASERGMAIALDFYSFTKDDLLDAVDQILRVPSYKNNAKRLSEVFRDQPQTPTERGAYWIEYVIRHKGAPHLRSGGKDLNWFQYHLLDVYAFLLLLLVALFTLFLTVFYFSILLITYLLYGKSKKPKKD